MPAQLFHNHDACGDVIIHVGGVEFQTINVATNLFFAAAGSALVVQSRNSEARQSGILLVGVAWFSAVYHATSSWGGFLLDIASMAIWATHLVGCCQNCCAALGHGVILPRPRSPEHHGEWLMAVVIVGSACAVGAPFAAFEAFDANPVTTWNFWANSFLVLILIVALPGLFCMAKEGLLRPLLGTVVAAVVIILVGVVFTQLIHAMCVAGQFTLLPLHSMWHLCAATSAYLLVSIVDHILSVVGERSGGHDVATVPISTRKEAA